MATTIKKPSAPVAVKTSSTTRASSARGTQVNQMAGADTTKKQSKNTKATQPATVVAQKSQVKVGRSSASVKTKTAPQQATTSKSIAKKTIAQTTKSGSTRAKSATSQAVTPATTPKKAVVAKAAVVISNANVTKRVQSATQKDDVKAKTARVKVQASQTQKTQPVKSASRLNSTQADFNQRARANNTQTDTAQTHQTQNAQSMINAFAHAQKQLFSQWPAMFGAPTAEQAPWSKLPKGMTSWLSTGNASDDVLADMTRLVDTADLERLQKNYVQQMGLLWQKAVEQQTSEIKDKRFSARSWHDNAWANYLAQSYLVNAQLMKEMAECVKADAKTHTRIGFSVMQWVDSMAPSNYFATNPDVQEKLTQTNGESLRMGMVNFFNDVQKGRISQTDETAFEIGVNVARSEGAVVFENPYFQLIQYAPLTPKVGARPLLFVPPCINKYYILDLQPDNSLVRHAIEAGNTVYLISWRNANESLSHTTWDDYVEQVVIKAIHLVQEMSQQDKINVLGFCVGGTILSTALAVLAARGEDPVASLTLLTTLLDFSDNGVLDAYVDEQQVMLREQALAKGGLMLGKELANAFASLRPNDLVWNYVVSNYLKGDQPTAFDLLYWNSDATNLPGPMFCWYLRNTYLENRLVQKAGVTCCGEGVDLSRINVPTYILACREDHIVPWPAAYRSQAVLGGDKRFVLAASGHIAGVVNSAKKNKRSYWSNPQADLEQSRDQWFSGAVEHPGSWWTDWTDWLRSHAGQSVNAPTKLGTVSYQVIESAPGRYVKERVA